MMLIHYQRKQFPAKNRLIGFLYFCIPVIVSIVWNVVGFKPVFDVNTWSFGFFTVIDDLGPGSKLLAVICWISVIHEYLPKDGETWDDGAEFPERWGNLGR